MIGSVVSLYRIAEVEKNLDAVNSVSIPLGKLLAQLGADAEMMRRESERRLGHSHWHDKHWKPRPLPQWVDELVADETARVRTLIENRMPWAAAAERELWKTRIAALAKNLETTKASARALYDVLEKRDTAAAGREYGVWAAAVEDVMRTIEWSVSEHDKILKKSFALAESRVNSLRMALQGILAVVVLLSMLLLWLSERALRPLARLTKMAREIALRGPRKEDKTNMPVFEVGRRDEVGELAREFHNMATALIEREKTVEQQQVRLQEQHRLLREAENLAAVGRMSAQVAHEVRNPLHSIGLEAELAAERAHELGDIQLKQSMQSVLASVDRLEKIIGNYLRLSRLSAGDKCVFDLGEALENVLAIYASACEAQSVRVDWSRGEAASLAVCADRELVEQALGNLMKNALQSLQDGGTKNPEIRWSMGVFENGRAWIKIEDNGPGVPDGLKDRIFTPFVTSKAQGTGLGLSFVKKVADEHGGSVRLVSAPGGSFEIALPMAMQSVMEGPPNGQNTSC